MSRGLLTPKNDAMIDWVSPVNWLHPLNRGLVSWWLCTPGASGGRTIQDLCRRNYGTLTNMEPESDWRDDYLDLGGTDEYVNIDSVAATLRSSNTFAVSLWARAATNQIGLGLSIGTGTTASKLFGFYPFDTTSGNGARVFYGNTSLINENGIDRCDGKLHHFAFTSRSATDHQLTVDGKSVGSSSSSVTMASDVESASIGRWDSGQFFTGHIHSVKIWSRGFSEAELFLDYCTGMNHVGPLNRVTLPRAVNVAAAAGNRRRRVLICGASS